MSPIGAETGSGRWPTFEDILAAYRDCRLGKQAGIHQIAFEKRLGENILKLHQEIHTGRYKPNPAVCFVVTYPKPREIFAAHFRDRIVHHLAVSQLTPKWERTFIHSSFACRMRKGTHGAIRYLQKKVRSVSQGGRFPVWALQLDIASFFVTIHRPTLKQLLLNEVRHAKLRELVETIYSHDARVGAVRKGSIESFSLIPTEKTWFHRRPDQGIPIGNLTSQFGANVYLTHLDHWICRTLRPEGYLRYMDDFTVLDRDPEKLRQLAKPIDEWIRKNRYQALNPLKTRLTSMTQGIEYLGYRVRQERNPSEPAALFLLPKKKWEWIKEVRRLEQSEFSDPEVPHPLGFPRKSERIEKQLARLNSRLGFLIHARSYRLRKKSMDRLVDQTTEFRNIPEEICTHRRRLTIKGDYQSLSS